jgi:hypothetical protein
MTGLIYVKGKSLSLEIIMAQIKLIFFAIFWNVFLHPAKFHFAPIGFPSP